ncbi:MAG: hypothetical protein NPIRA04_27230 [Nitrospirales bacterium]|nr:MAG: hypothetical protein NPIRA04_27230 [Nitrospirales bacterium]
MSEFIQATTQLYQQALQSTIRSFLRGWMMTLVVVGFAMLMMVVTLLASSLGMLGGLIAGAANAFVIGATLYLIEQVVLGARKIQWADIPQSAGQYFWDVISVGFLVWFPLMMLEMALQANPYRPVLTTAVFFLVFVLLNPVPEVIYQRRPGSAMEVVRESYEFVLENWIEWFLPIAILLAPFGLSFFFEFSSQAGMRGGLDFFQIFTVPFRLLTSWLEYFGISNAGSSVLIILCTPILGVFMLIFRGHLFSALHGSTRRQRQFQARSRPQ